MLNRNRNRRGAATVEFAITAPILFLLLFGGFELSRANMLMHTCEAAAYEGARVGIIPGATSQEVSDAVTRILATVGVNNASVQVQPDNLQTESQSVAVTVQFTFQENSLLVPDFMGTEPFVRTCELLREIE
jgi:Flp pilus assembly protein TadG